MMAEDQVHPPVPQVSSARQDTTGCEKGSATGHPRSDRLARAILADFRMATVTPYLSQ